MRTGEYGKIEIGSCHTAIDDWPKPSKWRARCSDITYTPAEGKEPCRFHRWVYGWMLGIKWTKSP